MIIKCIYFSYENKVYMQHIKRFGTKIYFDGIGMSVKYMLIYFDEYI